MFLSCWRWCLQRYEMLKSPINSFEFWSNEFKEPNMYYYSRWCQIDEATSHMFYLVPQRYTTTNPSWIGRVSWGSRIHRLLLCREVRLPQRVSWYNTKQSDDEASVMLEIWRMQSTPSLLSLPGPLYPEWYHLIWSYLWVKTVYLVLIELFYIKLFLHLICVLMLNWIGWNRTVFDI